MTLRLRPNGIRPESNLAGGEVRKAAVAEAAVNGAALYCMPGGLATMNGHYNAGNPEGIVHYHPEFRAVILADKETLICR